MTPEIARAFFEYCPATGLIHWKAGRMAGKLAFNANSHGYKMGTPFGKGYPAHRVAWLLVTGKWPEGEIDHINGIRDDNRWCNLREVTRAENCRNAALPKDNTSGHIGVTYMSASNSWMVRLGHTYIGLYPTKAAAIAARKKAEVEAGYHPNHGQQRPHHL